MLNRLDSSLFHRDTGLIQGRSIFFQSISPLLSKPNIYLKQTVLLKLLKVTVKVQVMEKSTFEGFAPKDTTWKTEFFVYVIQGCCLTGARSPEAPKLRVRATKVLFKEPEWAPKHGVFTPI